MNEPIVNAPRPIGAHEIAEYARTQAKAIAPYNRFAVVIDGYSDRIALNVDAVEGVVF